MNTYKPVLFDHLAESREFAQLCKLTFRLTGIRVALNDPSFTRIKIFHEPLDIPPICSLILKAGYKSRCDACDKEHFLQALEARQSITYLCHAGLIDMTIPIYIEGRLIAAITCGQLLPHPHSKQGMRKMWRQNRVLGISLDEFRTVYETTPYLDPEKLDAAQELVRFFAEHLCEVGRRLQEAAEANNRNEIKAAYDFVHSRFRESIRRVDVAKHVKLSPSYFGNLFKRQTEQSFTDYLHMVRVSEATKLLEKTRVPITTIAFDCGFGSLSQFNRTFSKIEGCSPREYRKKFGSAAPEDHANRRTIEGEGGLNARG